MSANDWNLIDADLSKYSNTKFKAGGRLYFIKPGRKNVSIYELSVRKNVSLRMSALPKFFIDEADKLQQSILDKYTNTLKNIYKTFMLFKQKTNIEKNILDTLKKYKK